IVRFHLWTLRKIICWFPFRLPYVMAIGRYAQEVAHLSTENLPSKRYNPRKSRASEQCARSCAAVRNFLRNFPLKTSRTLLFSDEKFFQPIDL
ncbi:hypothetical protein, partial [Pseudomonas sp. M47T1]|uniref:hypothetical protein n=1 Tax=Pseudomonas sp. M47T1 TaxID=1179778 RepID=UPI001EE682BC